MAQSCTKHENHACVVCHVGPRSVWHDLDEAASTLLVRGRRRREYGSGEAVFVQGEQNDGVHCVSGGTVGIRRLDDNGHSVLLELAYPGDTIGYRSFLTGSEHKTSAEALGPSVVCHIDRAAITALLAGNPAIGLRFLKRSIGELEHAHDMMFRQATLSNRLCRAGTSPRWSARATRPSRVSSDGSRPMEWHTFPVARSRSPAWKRSRAKSIG